MVDGSSFTDDLAAFIRTQIGALPLHNPERIIVNAVLTELQLIVQENSHPTAVARARTAIRHLALRWLSSDQLKARLVEYHGKEAT